MNYKCPKCGFAKSESIRCPECHGAWMDEISSPGWRDVLEELLNWIDSNRGSTLFGESIVYVDELNKKINELLTSPPGTDKG